MDKKVRYMMPQDLLTFFHVATKKPIRPYVKPKSGIVLNVGPGYKEIVGTTEIDFPEWDAEKDRLPYGDDTVGGIFAFGFLEHIRNVTWVLQEFQRVLKDGAPATLMVPYYNSQLYAQCLDHKSMFCEETWRCTFDNPCFDWVGKDELPFEWRFEVGINMIMGQEERNMFLLTQLIKKAPFA